LRECVKKTTFLCYFWKKTQKRGVSVGLFLGKYVGQRNTAAPITRPISGEAHFLRARPQKPRRGSLMELSKQVQRHKDLTDKLVALVESREKTLPDGLQARLAKRLVSGEVMPDVALLARLIVREWVALQEEESAADLELTREAGDDPAVLKALEVAQQALYSEMTLLRSEVETGHGATGIEALGMKGSTPIRAQDLETYAKSVLDGLLNEKVSLGEPRSKRMPFNRRAAAESLAPLVQALEVANKDFTREEAELAGAQQKRSKTIINWKTGAPPLAAVLRSLFILAGDEKGAARIILNPYRKGKEEDIDITEEE
jgi:hypothetical protein